MNQQHKAVSTAYLLDTDGTVGRAYGAKTTPHMYVIDAKGTLVYAGGIDDKPSTDTADIATARNFVAAALEESMAGKRVSVSSSRTAAPSSTDPPARRGSASTPGVTWQPRRTALASASAPPGPANECPPARHAGCKRPEACRASHPPRSSPTPRSWPPP